MCHTKLLDVLNAKLKISKRFYHCNECVKKTNLVVFNTFSPATEETQEIFASCVFDVRQPRFLKSCRIKNWNPREAWQNKPTINDSVSDWAIFTARPHAVQAIITRWQYNHNYSAFVLVLSARLPPPPPPPPVSHHPHTTVWVVLLLAFVNAHALMAMASSLARLKNACLPLPFSYLLNNETTQGNASIHNGAAVEPSWLEHIKKDHSDATAEI